MARSSTYSSSAGSRRKNADWTLELLQLPHRRPDVLEAHPDATESRFVHMPTMVFDAGSKHVLVDVRDLVVLTGKTKTSKKKSGDFAVELPVDISAGVDRA